MKIKSWTGDEVEARVGMVVDTGTGDEHVLTDIDFNRGYIAAHHSDTWEHIHFDDCTMLYCPFQFGDCVHHCLDGGDFIAFTPTKITRHDLDVEKDKGDSMYLNKYFRHANPNLRTSPEYKP